MHTFRSRRRRCYGTQNYVPMMGSNILDSKKGQKELQSSGFLYICINYSYATTTKYGSSLQIPYSNSKSYVHVAETPTCGYLTRIPEGAINSVPRTSKRSSHPGQSGKYFYHRTTRPPEEALISQAKLPGKFYKPESTRGQGVAVRVHSHPVRWNYCTFPFGDKRQWVHLVSCNS